MAREEKPYRVYRGGRVKGKVPAPSAPGAHARAATAVRQRRGAADYRGPGRRGAEAPPRWGRRIALGILGALVLLSSSGRVASWFSVLERRLGREQAARPEREARRSRRRAAC